MYNRFGPLRHHWCMCFEAKNAQIKSFGTHCFKNVPLYVSIRHQRWLYYHLSVRPGDHRSNFLYREDEYSGKMELTE